MKKNINEKGQALVEFAVILPILALLLMGIFEFGIMFNGYLTIQHASREGARLAAVGGNDGAIITQVKDVSPNIDEGKLIIEISPEESTRNRGDSVTVKVRYQYSVINPMIGGILGNEIPLDAQTIMRIE